MKKSQLHWKCIKNCGACCRLAPLERSEALKALSTLQTEEYLNMVGKDGWCIHFDTGSRRCKIYEERPDFCKVSKLAHLFNVAEKNKNQFAIQCCRQQIRSIYGGKSLEMRTFQRSQAQKVEKNG